MAESRGWVPVFVLAVTTLIVCGDDSKLEDSSLNACRFEPSVSRAVSMECDYNGIISSTIIGQLPPSIQEIRMRNSSEMNISSDIFSHLHSLQNIHLNDIRTLQINSNNFWNRIEQPNQVTITIERVSELSLHRIAFSGWSDPGPNIIIRNVTRCLIGMFAFSHHQSVVLQNIQNLTLDMMAFDADIDQLELVNVSLGTGCGVSSFSGRIRNLSLRSVNFTKVGTLCLNAGIGGWDSLTVRSSYFGNIKYNGIEGTINDVVIEDSRLGHVYSEGLHLSTSTFTMNSTVVEELATDALSVDFNQSASLQRSTINSLRANAFRQLKPRSGGAGTLTIEQVSVGAAEDGSLAFSKQTQPTLLDVVLRDPCECDVDKWALRLVVGDAPTRNATDEQQRAVRQIVDQVRCTAGTDTVTLAEFHCPNYCSAKDGDIAPCSRTLPIQTSPMASPTAVGVWVFLVGIGTPLLLLLLALGAARMMVRRRRSRQREEHPPADQLRNNCRTQDVTPEPAYSEPEYVQPDERHTSSAFGAPSSTDHPHALQSEPEDSDVDTPVLPCPPSSVYLEMMPLSAEIPGQSVDIAVMP